ncbi:hypothetical protein [Paenibacillus wynnii]|uniref:Uncharacterized protein n=1 Tax=Paenibacillus wynnii TaxID=268407 RepID=A0A098MCB7_9BACL|nr:hypothetical protein [Paenibacillus wynnii]KGE19197.1 hypothetical protein PWYN_07415 [Paenibacillus wynnii]
MQASIQPDFTWSKNHIFAGGAQNIVLLVEWRGAPSAELGSKKNHKTAAREIELRLWLEPHIVLTRMYGSRALDGGDDRSVLLPLGKIQTGQRKYIALEFALKPAHAGKHDVVWLHWQFKQPYGERICELPMQKLSLEYSHHTSVLQESCSFHVEKHLELLRTEEVLEEADLLRSKEKQGEARELVRRHADKLLLLAVRTGDRLLTREAESLYRRSELTPLPNQLAEDQDIRTECI